MVAAAVLGGGLISGISSIWGSSNAANAQKEAANAMIANTNKMYESNKGLAMPYINAGTDMLGGLQNWLKTDSNNPLSTLIKLTTPGADMNSVLEGLPGYQFQLGQGNRAVQNALAARGLGGSAGAVAKGVANYTQGLAQSSWGNLVDKLQNVFGAGTNAMQGLVNTGANAVNSLTGAGAAATNSINSALGGIGNANANMYNSIGGAIGGMGNSLSSYMMMKSLMGGGGGGGGSGSIYGPLSLSPGIVDYNSSAGWGNPGVAGALY